MSFLTQRKSILSKSLSQMNESNKALSPERNVFPCGEEGAWKITFFRARLKAAMTLEAALALTLFLLLLTSLCQIFLIMELQLHMQRALEQVSNEAAGYSYVSSQIPMWESESRLLNRIQDYLLTELSEEALRLRLVSVLGEGYLERSMIEGGAGGLSLAGSGLLAGDRRIRLTVSYQIRLPLAAAGFQAIELSQRSYRYAWLGDAETERTDGQEEQEEPMVYVTQNGQVYHLTLSCTHLNLSVRSVAPGQIESLRNQNGARYYACEHCRPGGRETVLYITDDGTRYHGTRECGGISRNVTAIPLSQVGDRRPCSRCGQQE